VFLFDIDVSSANALYILRTVIGLYLAQITFWFAGVTRVIGRVIDGKLNRLTLTDLFIERVKSRAMAMYLIALYLIALSTKIKKQPGLYIMKRSRLNASKRL
jgi:hypothetical protein